MGGVVSCGLCDAGFPGVSGIHLPTQRLGMIPNTPCALVRPVHLGNATDDNIKPWIVYIGDADRPLLNKSSVPRRFATEKSALLAGARTLPDATP